MKYLILLTFFFPIISYSNSYLCISEAAAGIKQNYGQNTFKSMRFHEGRKYIVKQINNEWKAFPFGEKDDSSRANIAKCEIFNNDSLLVCETLEGIFKANFNELSFIAFSEGDWVKKDRAYMGDAGVEIGSCSAL